MPSIATAPAPDNPPMNLLAFDTSTDQVFIALQRADQQWLWQGAGGAASSTHLIPQILQGMHALQLQWADLAAIVFGQGPGSFTGLRTACSVAQGLALGAELPVLPIPSLCAVAEAARQTHGLTEVMAVLDARMSEVYHAHWRYLPSPEGTAPGAAQAGQWQAVSPIGLCAPGQLPLPSGLAVAGNAQAAYADLAPQAAHYHALPTATALLALAPALLASGAAMPAAQALPLYVRDKVAQTTAERAAVAAAKAAVSN